MKTTLVTLAFLIFMVGLVPAQNTHFVTSGTIEYEKSVNTFAIINRLYGNNMEGYMQTAYEQYKKNQPQFRTAKSTLKFSDNKTLFTPIIPENTVYGFFGLPMTEQYNTIYSDISTNTSAIQKIVFEQTFLIKDTIRKVKWKITGETREIAGYSCRRANGLLMDSIYAVAFYTDKIPVSGGPESFAGLPGMILEVALPHENITWRATKVEDTFVDATAVVMPKKGKPISNKQLFETLMQAFKNRWDGKQINFIMKMYLL